MESLSFICRALFMVLYLSAFTLFVAFDAINAFKKRKHWVPGKALVLSAITISALTFLDTSTNSPAPGAFEELRFLLYDQVLIDGGRLGVCVFLAYLLPGMVASRSGKDLRLIAAFVISLFAQILSELRIVVSDDRKTFKGYIKSKMHETYFHWFILSNAVFFVSIVFLICALCSTVLACYTIRSILSKRISVILGAGDEMVMSGNGDPETQKDDWNDFEEEIFKSWIVARASQPHYVISRSVVNSAAAMVVFLCIGLSIIKLIWMNKNYHDTLIALFNEHPLLLFELWAMFGFYIVGWTVIGWRWITTLIYFPKLGKGVFSFRRYFCVEKFWTCSIDEMIPIYDMKASALYQRQNDINSLLAMVVARMRLHKLLHLLCAIQICMVLLCKSALFLVELAFPKIIVGWLHNNKEGGRSQVSGPRYEKYADILERLCMPGEDPASLWSANRSSITQVQLQMKNGRDRGKECNILISNSDQFSLHFIEEGCQLMSKLRREDLAEVTKYFPNLDEPCWKMTAITLLHLLIKLHGQKSDRLFSAVKACRQAWDLLNLVDYTHIEPDGLSGFSLLDNLSTESHQSSMAADKEFCRLQALYEDLPISAQIKTATECLSDLSKEAADVLKTHMLLVDGGQNYALTQRKAAENFDLHDSMNWMEIAPKYSLYKLCRVVEMEVDEVDDVAAWTEKSLTNVIAACLSKLPHMLIKYSRQLAQEFDEDNLWNVVYLAGKARGVMENAGLHLILTVKKLEQEIEWTVETNST